MKLSYFKKSEFYGNDENWFGIMNIQLLIRIDILRYQYGKAIVISPHPLALGRRDNTDSQHNYEKWGKINAVDIIPEKLEYPKRFFELAVHLGFTGIGYYPDWNPSPGFHLDVRENRDMGYPDTWGGINKDGEQVYVGLDQVLKTD